MISHQKSSKTLAIGLASLAGFVDALGFLNLGGVFVSFMSGNSTRFAVGVTSELPLKITLIPLGIIALFVAGVMAGRAIRHYFPKRPSTAVMVFISAALTVSSIIHGSRLTLLDLPLMAIAMGAANNVFFREGEVSVGVTYMTGTLVKLGQRLAGKLLGEKEQEWLPYFLLWMGLVAGATLGSFTYTHWGLHALWIGVALCLALTQFCAWIENK
ncbi:uncharacterized membrane protein YoaK (UPF0700 family) [Dyadobacter jejuensis]|uniref:Uncharacterized membrane protein YoaK (UPF0700 family) n=1 Tax=Dyadobacter jejuensis TaxID=1082580 RepID=A0A316AH28_9BACT|nr:YoaK family protein [Dyadobacter jejuensis]PWJ57045.1 uncharacterized membrane protein YoaK (UPF0700 family) [Dyadobacter jejuensis]